MEIYPRLCGMHVSWQLSPDMSDFVCVFATWGFYTGIIKFVMGLEFELGQVFYV